MNGELWKDVLTMDPYQASDAGRVRNKTTGHVLTTRPRSQRGYPAVVMSLPDGTRRDVYVHHAVLLAFVGPPKPGQIALHADDDPNNNTPGNLRWGTYSDNALDSVRNGTHRQARKSHCDYGHELADWNNYPTKSGWRTCAACREARAYAAAARVPLTQSIRDRFYSPPDLTVRPKTGIVTN